MTKPWHRAGPGRLPQVRILLCASVAFPLLATGASAADLETDLNWLSPPASDTAPAWNAWGSLGGAWNSDTESFGEFVIFAPLMQDENSLFFGEFRGRYFEDDLLAGNAALGVRQMTDSGFNLGAWVGLDVFQSAADNTFGQRRCRPGSTSAPTAISPSPIRRKPPTEPPRWS